MVVVALIFDLFAGPGGWDEALRQLGQSVLGVEWDDEACNTRVAAGHLTYQGDIAAIDIDDLVALYGKPTGLIASPPCQAFSQAGSRKGVGDLPRLYDHVRDVRCEERWLPVSADEWADPRSELVLEPLRWVDALRPEWIALEQVPPVLPLWEEFAYTWRELGYSTWTGILNAANYGVPQTRRRAILMAHRDRRLAGPPHPTHAEEPGSSLFGQLLPWVSMADALGWGAGDKPCATVTGGGTEAGGGAEPVAHWNRFQENSESWVGFPRKDDRGTSEDGYRDRDKFPTDGPAPVVTEKARSWVVSTGRDWKKGGSREDSQQIPVTDPAPTVDGTGRWFVTRPATTIAGDPRVFPPGSHIANDGRDNSKAVGRSEGAIRVTEEDALVLQGFRRDYPVQGNRSKRFEQIGNAIPPPLAKAILTELTRGR